MAGSSAETPGLPGPAGAGPGREDRPPGVGNPGGRNGAGPAGAGAGRSAGDAESVGTGTPIRGGRSGTGPAGPVTRRGALPPAATGQAAGSQPCARVGHDTAGEGEGGTVRARRRA